MCVSSHYWAAKNPLSSPSFFQDKFNQAFKCRLNPTETHKSLWMLKEAVPMLGRIFSFQNWSHIMYLPIACPAGTHIPTREQKRALDITKAAHSGAGMMQEEGFSSGIDWVSSPCPLQSYFYGPSNIVGLFLNVQFWKDSESFSKWHSEEKAVPKLKSDGAFESCHIPSARNYSTRENKTPENPSRLHIQGILNLLLGLSELFLQFLKHKKAFPIRCAALRLKDKCARVWH